MARSIYLLSAGLTTLSVLLLPISAAAANGGGCTSARQRVGLCTTANVSEESVELSGFVDRLQPGLAGAQRRPGLQRVQPLTQQEAENLLNELCYGDGDCGVREPGTLNPLIPTAEPGQPPEPKNPPRAVTIEDVARFLPARGVLHGEPSGWAVVGVPANFWVEVEPMTVTGELLGDVAQVRFTPTLYTFDYGDGTTRTSAEPGSSWRDLGQDELSATPTGHVFRERGDRPVRVTIAYTAEYRVDGGAWIGVAGAVSAAAPGVNTLVVAERTVLTAGASR